MGELERDPLSQLAWVAFLAEQLGWTELADRISDDLAAAHERSWKCAVESSPDYEQDFGSATYDSGI